MKYDLLRIIGSSRWLMPTEEVKKLAKAIDVTSEESIQATIAARQAGPAQPQIVGSTAVINVTGPITYRDTFFSRYFGSATIEGMQAQFRAALADDTVANILWRIESPGGIVDMVPEFAAEIFKARGRKPMVAVVDTMMCSAASWIGLQADQVVAPGSALVGSIGAYLLHIDVSKMLEAEGIKMTFISSGEGKVDGNPYAPLDEDTRARLQEDVDEIYTQFVFAAARARGVKQSAVIKTWKAHVYSGDKAMALGMIDRKATFAEVIERTSKQRAGSQRMTMVELLSDLPTRGAGSVGDLTAVVTVDAAKLAEAIGVSTKAAAPSEECGHAAHAGEACGVDECECDKSEAKAAVITPEQAQAEADRARAAAAIAAAVGR